MSTIAEGKPVKPIYCLSCSSNTTGSDGLLPGHAANATSSSCTYCPYGTSRTATSTWLCLKGVRPDHQTFSLRMGYAGRPECASLNGKNCIRSITGPDGKVVFGCAGVAARLNKDPLAAGGPLKTLRCGADHKRAWNITGYDEPQHWCLVANEFYQDHQPGVCFCCGRSDKGHSATV